MAKYIPLDVVLAKIEKIIADETESIKCFERRRNVSEVQRSNARIGVLMYLRALLDTLEVKEIDLEKELVSWRNNHFHGRRDKEASGEYLERVSQLDLAKHFFELGLRASNSLTWEDVKKICVQSVLVEIDLGRKVSDEKHYTEVLKRFKEQKGE